jgi:predicted deacylase
MARAAPQPVEMVQPIQPHPVDLLPPHLARWHASASGVPYVHERQGNATGPNVLVTALVHGNEYAGAIVIDALLASGWNPARGRVTFAFCNVAAFERFHADEPDASRFIDEDFNRVWSDTRLDAGNQASVRAGKPSVELQRARQILPFVARATHLLDLHSMHEPCAPLWVTGQLPRNIQFAQSLQTSCQAIIDSGHADGVRMRDHGGFADADGQRIALLLEAGQHWDRSTEHVARNCLMRFLVQAGSIDRQDVPPGMLLPDCTPPPPVQVTHRVVAQSMDFEFTEGFNGGEVIAKAGTVIARQAGIDVPTPYDNCVLVMPSVRQLRVGVTTVRFGTTDHCDKAVEST